MNRNELQNLTRMLPSTIVNSPEEAYPAEDITIEDFIYTRLRNRQSADKRREMRKIRELQKNSIPPVSSYMDAEDND